MKDIFSEPRYVGRPLRACPACYAGENAQHAKGVYDLELLSGNDLSQLTQQRVADDSVLESMMVEELDEHGQPVMVQTGERYELRVNPDTGEIYSEPVPVMEPKMRSLTDQELAALKQQRDRTLDELEKVAVKEVTE